MDTQESHPRHLLIATAGHVDHGKTSLVRALTGIDTDRLPEEKARGISITCGFAATSIGPHTMSFIDVPGHERFIREMSGGASGADAVLLVVAADEGPMPQTREHLEIAEFLGIRRLVVAITCCDRVDAAWAELVEHDVHRWLGSTRWQNPPIIRCSALRGDGLDALRAALVDVTRAGLDDEHQRLAQRPFALPIDRVFTRAGHGTVVTGTTLTGRIEVGARVWVIGPAGRFEARVRRLERHGAGVASAGPGERLALNLAGLEQDDVRRGMWLTTDGRLRAETVLDGWLAMSPRLSQRLPRGASVIVQVGPGATEARLFPMEGDDLAPGETTPVELRLRTPLPWFPGAGFVVRGFERLRDAGLTWGGGTLVSGRDTPMPRVRRNQRATLVRALNAGNATTAVTALLEDAAYHGMPIDDVIAIIGSARTVDLDATRTEIAARTDVRVLDGHAFRLPALGGFERAMLSTLAAHHTSHPGEPGVLRSHLPALLRTQGLRHPPDEACLDRLLRIVEESGAIRRQADILSLPHFSSATPAPDERIFTTLSALLKETGATPPWRSDLRTEVERRTGEPAPTIERAIQRGLRERHFVRVTPDLLFDRDTLVALARKVTERFEKQATLTTGELKDLLGTTRKWLVPLLEWFDRERLTVRRGETRVRHPSGRQPETL